MSGVSDVVTLAQRLVRLEQRDISLQESIRAQQQAREAVLQEKSRVMEELASLVGGGEEQAPPPKAGAYHDDPMGLDEGAAEPDHRAPGDVQSSCASVRSSQDQPLACPYCHSTVDSSKKPFLNSKSLGSHKGKCHANPKVSARAPSRPIIPDSE